MKQKIHHAKETVKKHPVKSFTAATIASMLIAEASGVPVPLVDAGVRFVVGVFNGITSSSPKGNAAETPAESSARSPAPKN